MPKKRILSFLLVIVMSLGASCSANKTATTPTETDNSQSKNTIISCTPTADVKFRYLASSRQDCLASVEIPYFDGEDTVNSLIISNLNTYLYNTFGMDFALTETYDEIDPKTLYGKYIDDAIIDHSIHLDCSVKYESLELTSLVFSGTAYGKQAAHPIHLFFTINIDRLTGKRILTRDIYPVDEQLYNIFDHYAYADLEERANAEWLANLDKDNLYTKDKFLAGLQEESDYCTYFTATHLGISYPVTFAMGNHIEVEIPYSELGIIMEQ